MAKMINIKDSKPYVLDDNNLAYILDNGSANVYISEFIKGKPSLRLFLKELNPGDCVSGLSKKFNGCEYKIFIVNSARDNKEDIKKISLSCKKTNSKLKEKFLKDIDLLINDKDYAQNLVQHYLINEVKGSRNIYSDYLTNINAENDTIANIASSFNEKTEEIENLDSNANDLYFALATVAKANKIKHVAFEDLNTKQKSNLSPQIFAEYSSCICKRIMLDDDWYKHDIGNFVTNIDGKKGYVACIFRKNKYYYISKEKPYFTKIDKNNVSQFSNFAYCLYRILPERKLNIKDVFQFIYDCISFKYIFAILLMGLAVSIIGMISPIINQFIYDVLIPNKDFWGLFGCACILLSMIVGSGSVSLVKSYASLSVSSKIKYALQIALFDRVFKLRQSFIKKYEPADLSMRILGIGNIFTALATQTVASIVTFIFSFLYLYQMFIFMPDLCAPAICITLIILVVLLIFSKVQYKWYLKSTLIGIEKSSLLYQLIRGISKLRTSGAENRAINKYMEKHISSSKLNYKSNYYSTMIGILGALISSIAMVIFYLGVYSKGLVASVGSFMGFVSAYGIFSSALMQIPTCYLSYLQAKPWINRLKPIMNEIPEKSVLSQTMDEISGEIDVRHITFSYEKDSPIVLDDLSFNVKKGEYIGIAGASGSGKSTIFNLLLGFEHQDKGKIYYDHHDLDEVNKKELRQNFGVVLQDGDIVSGSIYDNIAIAKPDATYEEVMDVLDKVGMTDEVNLMPMGVFTMLSEGSGLISGGQKQRILIARALINKPKVLFMDEATSALDNIVQAKISNYLKTIDCTKIVIAHRLSTIINCDKILVLDEGKIAESGTYDELMKAKGIFYNLAKRQLS